MKDMGDLAKEFKSTMFNGVKAYERIGPRVAQGEISEDYLTEKTTIFVYGDHVYEIKTEWPAVFEKNLLTQSILRSIDDSLKTFRFTN